MNYCGIDLGGVSSYVYITTDRGRKLWSGPVETTSEAFEARLRRFRRDGLGVAIEAGNQTAWVYEALVAMGAKVTVVNPNKVKLIAESRRKTDKVDARILCELLRIDALPHPVHMPGRQTRALRGLLVARRQLVAARTKLCNVVRGMLRQEGLRLPAGALSSFAGWERVFVNSFSCEHVMTVVRAYYQSFKALTQSIHELDRKLAERERKEPRAKRLQTMPRDRTDSVVDVSGGRGRCASFSIVTEASGLLGAGPYRAAEQRADGVRVDQPGRAARVASRVGADCPLGGDRSAPRHAAATELVQPSGEASWEEDSGCGFGQTAVGNSVPLVARGNEL